MIMGHGSSTENLISVLSIGVIFLIRKFAFVHSFGSSLPDGAPAPDMDKPNSHESDETFA